MILRSVHWLTPTMEATVRCVAAMESATAGELCAQFPGVPMHTVYSRLASLLNLRWLVREPMRLAKGQPRFVWSVDPGGALWLGDEALPSNPYGPRPRGVAPHLRKKGQRLPPKPKAKPAPEWTPGPPLLPRRESPAGTYRAQPMAAARIGAEDFLKHPSHTPGGRRAL